MTVADENKKSGVELYIFAARELAEDVTSEFRQNRARLNAKKLPELDRNRIGFLKFNLAKSVQTFLRNGTPLAKEHCAAEAAASLTAICTILERMPDRSPDEFGRTPRVYRPGVDD